MYDLRVICDFCNKKANDRDEIDENNDEQATNVLIIIIDLYKNVDIVDVNFNVTKNVANI